MYDLLNKTVWDHFRKQGAKMCSAYLVITVTPPLLRQHVFYISHVANIVEIDDIGDAVITVHHF